MRKACCPSKMRGLAVPLDTREFPQAAAAGVTHYRWRCCGDDSACVLPDHDRMTTHTMTDSQQFGGLPMVHRRVVPWEVPRAVLCIPLPHRPPVFMSVPPCDNAETSRSIVVVKASAFLEAWRADRGGLHVDVADRDPSTWPHDGKYHWAVDGFAPGITNPVPLAEVGCELLDRPRWHDWRPRHRERRASVSFLNGVTRTIWLLAQGVERFPVECPDHSAKLLADHCGVIGMRPESAYTLTHGMG